jgi:hypothetical protein
LPRRRRAISASIVDPFGPDLRYQRIVEDRRASPRHEAYISAALETSKGRTTIAITRDVSTTGLLILTRATLVVGETVKLTAALGDAPRTLSGKVVRVEPLEPHELWRHKVAIAIDDPALAAFHAALAGAQRPG